MRFVCIDLRIGLQNTHKLHLHSWLSCLLFTICKQITLTVAHILHCACCTWYTHITFHIPHILHIECCKTHKQHLNSWLSCLLFTICTLQTNYIACCTMYCTLDTNISHSTLHGYCMLNVAIAQALYIVLRGLWFTFQNAYCKGYICFLESAFLNLFECWQS